MSSPLSSLGLTHWIDSNDLFLGDPLKDRTKQHVTSNLAPPGNDVVTVRDLLNRTLVMPSSSRSRVPMSHGLARRPSSYRLEIPTGAGTECPVSSDKRAPSRREQ